MRNCGVAVSQQCADFLISSLAAGLIYKSLKNNAGYKISRIIFMTTGVYAPCMSTPLTHTSPKAGGLTHTSPKAGGLYTPQVQNLHGATHCVSSSNCQAQFSFSSVSGRLTWSDVRRRGSREYPSDCSSRRSIDDDDDDDGD